MSCGILVRLRKEHVGQEEEDFLHAPSGGAISPTTSTTKEVEMQDNLTNAQAIALGLTALVAFISFAAIFVFIKNRAGMVLAFVVGLLVLVKGYTYVYAIVQIADNLRRAGS